MGGSPAERLAAVEQQLRFQRVVSIVGCALAGIAAVVALIAMGRGGAEQPELWRTGPDGAVVTTGDVIARRFLVVDDAGTTSVVLGDPGGADAGPGVHVLAAEGAQPIAALWREQFAGRSRLRIGDVDARPIEVMGNAPRALLVAPEILTHQSPIVRPPSD